MRNQTTEVTMNILIRNYFNSGILTTFLGIVLLSGSWNLETWDAREPVVLGKNPRWQLTQSDLALVRYSVISPDGKIVVICGRTGFMQDTPFQLQIRTADSGKLLKVIDDLDGAVEFIHFSEDGKFFYTVRNKDKKFLAWKTNGESLKNFSVLDGVQGATLSPDNKTIALTGFTGKDRKSTLALYDFASGKPIKNLIERSNKEIVMSHIKFSGDNKRLYVAIEGKRKGILAVDADSGKEIYHANQKGWGGRFGIHERANFLATYEGENNRVNLFKLSDGSLIRSFPINSKDIIDLDIHPNAQQIIIGNRRPKEFIQTLNVLDAKLESYSGSMQVFNFSINPAGDTLSVVAFFGIQYKHNLSYAMYDMGSNKEISQLSSSFDASDFSLGHAVEANIGGSWNKGFVAQIATKSDQVLVEFPSGTPKDKEWVKASQLRFTNPNDRGVEPMSVWKVGDRVNATTGGKSYPGKINQVKKDTGWILVQFDNNQPKAFEWIRPWNLEK